MSNLLQNVFCDFSVDIFSQSKNPALPDKNEDVFVARNKVLSVIDGATEKGVSPFNYEGQTGGRFLARLIGECFAELASTSSSGLYPVQGKELVDLLTEVCQREFERLGISRELLKFPKFRPSASFAVAFILDYAVFITQLGDVSFRINGRENYENPRFSDQINSEKRREAILLAKKKNPDMSMEKLMIIGREAIIKPGFLKQGSESRNNPEHSLGHGVLNGLDVPEKYIRTFFFRRKDLETLEIFSDGYFGVAEQPTISSWEEFFASVEKEDPYKIGKYLSTKGSDPQKGIFTDDRTVIIAHFNA